MANFTIKNIYPVVNNNVNSMNDPNSITVSNGYSIINCYAIRNNAGPTFSLSIAPFCNTGNT